MKTIYKYSLYDVIDVFSGVVKLEMPKGAKILHVYSQQGRPCLLVLVDTANETEFRNFRIVGTGYEIDFDCSNHVGTWLQQDGVFVWHLFEV